MLTLTRRIQLSDKDKKILETEIQAESKEQPENYKNRVVLKPWGHEFLFFENDQVAAWMLYIKKDHATSLHAHPNKKTSLSILTGRALCNTFYTRNFLSGGEGVIIEKGVFHSTKALSYEGTYVVEIESPPNKSDLLRFQDNYGRKYAGYENTSQMTEEDLERYNHFYIAKDFSFAENILTRNANISIQVFQKSISLKNIVFQNDCIYSICKGEIYFASEKKLIAGDSEHGTILNDNPEGYTKGAVVLLKMRGFNLSSK